MSSRFPSVVSAVALLSATMLSALPAAAQETPQRRDAPRIAVAGEGEVAVAPDMAIVNLSVVREADTAKAALAANSAAMKQVIDALKAAGLAERDIQTTNFTIQPRYLQQSPRDKPQDPKIVGYAVSNEVTVHIRKLEEAGSIIDRVVGLGVNQGGGINFVKEDLKDVMTEARKRAVADAIAKARTLAEAAGAKLGPVLSISEGGMPPRAVPYATAPMRMAAEKAVPLASGENTYQAQVNMVFEIER